MAKINFSDTVVVIGLDRFGGAVAEALLELDHEVFGIDRDSATVQRWSDRLTHVVQADAADSETLAELGLEACQRAVVSIGSNIEASVLTVLALHELGVERIWAKAVTDSHGKILKRIGAHHVVSPEAEMGERVAHVVTGRMIDYVEFEAAFAIAKTPAPKQFHDKKIIDCDIRQQHGVTIIGIKKSSNDTSSPFDHAEPETLIGSGDMLVIAGPNKQVEAFAQL